MPKGPQGQKRPADTNACAVMVARIATGEIEDDGKANKYPVGVAGGLARAKKLNKEHRSEIATFASTVRWKKEAVR